MPKEKPNDQLESDSGLEESGNAAVAEPKSYYYDDSHGYENYDPERESDDKDEEDCDD